PAPRGERASHCPRPLHPRRWTWPSGTSSLPRTRRFSSYLFFPFQPLREGKKLQVELVNFSSFRFARKHLVELGAEGADLFLHFRQEPGGHGHRKAVELAPVER